MIKLLATLLVLTSSWSAAQVPGNGNSSGQPQSDYILLPDSSVEHPGDRGFRAHTNHLVLVHPQGSRTPAFTGETPASLACIYRLSAQTPGCLITGGFNAAGGGGVIAIVDAFHYATAENDLNVFSQKFNLPSCTSANGCFRMVYASGAQPKVNCGWNQEAALDIEWAHAMAPMAKIVLVEAASANNADLYAAVDAAGAIVAQAGYGEVSMSWGSSEFSSESSFDSHFQTSGVVYFASSGDTGGHTIYPGTSPNVVSAGGTSVLRSGGAFLSEAGWSGSGGGSSQYEYRPAYQDTLMSVVGMKRGVPDFSFDADPNTGVAVYDSTVCQGVSGWLVFGGTSVASPSLAGIVNLAGAHALSSTQELTTVYASAPPSSSYAQNFNDVTSGSAGTFKCKTGYDFVTGLGSNRGLFGK